MDLFFEAVFFMWSKRTGFSSLEIIGSLFLVAHMKCSITLVYGIIVVYFGKSRSLFDISPGLKAGATGL